MSDPETAADNVLETLQAQAATGVRGYTTPGGLQVQLEPLSELIKAQTALAALARRLSASGPAVTCAEVTDP